MACKKIKLEGATAIVCTRGKKTKVAPCGFCKESHTKLCDYPMRHGTCDLKMCDVHATNVGPDQDYCPTHKTFSLRDIP